MLRLGRVLLLGSIGLVSACAGAPPPPPRPVAKAPARAAKPYPGDPLVVDVVPRRAGGSVFVEVSGRAHLHPEGRPFEDPARWQIRARSGGNALARVVDGPVEIARAPISARNLPPGISDERFDVEVRFSVAFALPEQASTVEIEVEAPYARPFGRTFDGLAAPAPAPDAKKRRRARRR